MGGWNKKGGVKIHYQLWSSQMHTSGQSAILAQGDNYHDAKPLVIASQTTS